MTIQSFIRSFFLLTTVFLMLSAGAIQAQEIEAIELGREVTQLRVDISDAVTRDTDIANTALVFSNSEGVARVVVCTAFNGNGERLGRGVVRLPANGVRYIRASDLSDGVDFVGSAICDARGRVVATAVFLLPGAITDLDVQQRMRRRTTRMRFPLVATY